MPPDPKRPKRVVDRRAGRVKLMREGACRACGRPASNRHHLVQKGSPHFGDDLDDNIVPICGTGTTRCHGAFHGNPYTDEDGRRWESADVREAIGLSLSPSEYHYVVVKTSPTYDDVSRRTGPSGQDLVTSWTGFATSDRYAGGRDWLRREYGVEAVTTCPFVLRSIRNTP